ncbi:hypothetical protein ACSLOZ_29680, partial [Escherichia coli]
QFLKQQETLSQQLREKPDTQLQAWAEQQVRANPLQHSDNQFLTVFQGLLIPGLRARSRCGKIFQPDISIARDDRLKTYQQGVT